VKSLDPANSIAEPAARRNMPIAWMDASPDEYTRATQWLP
jgi:hypothetical protein